MLFRKWVGLEEMRRWKRKARCDKIEGFKEFEPTVIAS